MREAIDRWQRLLDEHRRTDVNFPFFEAILVRVATMYAIGGAEGLRSELDHGVEVLTPSALADADMAALRTELGLQRRWTGFFILRARRVKTRAARSAPRP